MGHFWSKTIGTNRLAGQNVRKEFNPWQLRQTRPATISRQCSTNHSVELMAALKAA
jgi:hypothetical protein